MTDQNTSPLALWINGVRHASEHRRFARGTDTRTMAGVIAHRLAWFMNGGAEGPLPGLVVTDVPGEARRLWFHAASGQWQVAFAQERGKSHCEITDVGIALVRNELAEFAYTFDDSVVPLDMTESKAREIVAALMALATAHSAGVITVP